jgi:hypothetical protein
MKEYQFSVDILCRDSSNTPAYRLYVDDNLITERTFIWDHNVDCVREQLAVQFEPGEHSLYIESATPNFHGFYYQKIKINGKTPQLITSNVFLVD